MRLLQKRHGRFSLSFKVYRRECSHAHMPQGFTIGILWVRSYLGGHLGKPVERILGGRFIRRTGPVA